MYSLSPPFPLSLVKEVREILSLTTPPLQNCAHQSFFVNHVCVTTSLLITTRTTPDHNIPPAISILRAVPPSESILSEMLEELRLLSDMNCTFKNFGKKD